MTSKRKLQETKPLVSVIIPVHNAGKYLGECFDSILRQSYDGPIEISVYNDGSSDDSEMVCKEWQEKFALDDRFKFIFSQGNIANGAAFARNRAISQSNGQYLCIHDADDISKERRIELQLLKCEEFPNAIIGSRFVRIPHDATFRYASWCNNLTQDQLLDQRFREITIIQPTWFFKRDVWERIGGYVEFEPDEPQKIALAEDLRFFYEHIEYCEAHYNIKDALVRVEDPLVEYRHLSGSVSSKTPRKLLTKIRTKAIERSVLKNWETFSIWGAGRDGKDFFKNLSQTSQDKVEMFIDIDPQKIARGYHNKQMKKMIPIKHFRECTKPFVTCVALDRTEGEFEKNLRSVNMTEGKDYFHFN